jgi:hypothetical protein
MFSIFAAIATAKRHTARDKARNMLERTRPAFALLQSEFWQQKFHAEKARSRADEEELRNDFKRVCIMLAQHVRGTLSRKGMTPEDYALIKELMEAAEITERRTRVSDAELNKMTESIFENLGNINNLLDRRNTSITESVDMLN